MKVRVLLDPSEIVVERALLKWSRYALLAVGLGLLGYTACIYVGARVDEAREERILDAPPPKKNGTAKDAAPAHPAVVEHALMGRIDIPRLKLHAVIHEGTDDATLRRSIGHVNGTAFPGEDGNVGLAGHRDTFFRGLRNVRKDDVIQVETFDRKFEYKVDSLTIVGPDDVEVLGPTPEPALTLVTCYPFRYVGNAPRRFIVRARQVAVSSREFRGS